MRLSQVDHLHVAIIPPLQTNSGTLSDVSTRWTARVTASSQYAAIENAISFTTDLKIQYELGNDIVSEANFSAETAYLAKNQILQQVATAMLIQANQGQRRLQHENQAA